MTDRHLQFGLLVASVFMLLLALRGETEQAQAPPGHSAEPTLVHALAAIPKQARFVMRLELGRPNAAPLRALLFNAEHEISGLGRLKDVCGYDPSPSVRELVVTALSSLDGAEPEFAIAASGDFERARLASCAQALVRSRGGHPQASEAGRLTWIRDVSRDTAEIAIVDPQLVLVGKHRILRLMLSVLDGHEPSVSENPTHRALADAVGAGVATSTLELDRGWLTRLFKTEEFRASPLTGLRAVAVSLNLEDSATLRAVLRCEDPEGCRKLRDFLGGLRREFAAALRARFGNLPLETAQLDQVESELRASWVLNPTALERLVTYLSKGGALRLPSAGPPPGSAAPQEIIPARPPAQGAAAPGATAR